MNKHIRSAGITVAVVLALATAVPAQVAPPAQESPDGRHRTFEDPLLDSLAGRWTLSREIRGRQERNTLDVEWVLRHQFLQLRMRDVAEPPKYEALVLIGYDHGGQRYVIHWADNFGGKFSSKGYGRRSGDSIEFVFADPGEPSFYNTFSRDPATGVWTFLMESQGKDGRVFFARDTLSRR